MNHSHEFITHCFDWHSTESKQSINSEMTKSNINPIQGSEQEQHDSSKHDLYQNLTSKLRQQKIKDNTKIPIDYNNSPSFIAPNHAFWNHSGNKELEVSSIYPSMHHNSDYFIPQEENKNNQGSIDDRYTSNETPSDNLNHDISNKTFKLFNESPHFGNILPSTSPNFGALVPSYPPPGYFSQAKKDSIRVNETLLGHSQDYLNIDNKLNSTKNIDPQVTNCDSLIMSNQKFERRHSTGVWMFVDNSNIWIECKRAEAKLKFKKNPLFDEDPRLRLDMGRLAEQVRKGRPIIDAQLYGSEPPEIDTIWQLATKKGWEVNRFKRNVISGKEKQLDTSIVADITELVCHSQVRKLKFEKLKNVIVLVAGDSDFIPAIRKVISQNGWWRIEVWGLARSMSNDIKQLSKEYPDIVQINYMDKDEIKKQFTFTHYKLDVKWNVDTEVQVLLYNYQEQMCISKIVKNLQKLREYF